jgi:hypothetical protein
MIKEVGANPLASCLIETDGSFVMALPESLPGETAAHVADLFLSARSNPVAVDASAVERIDTSCIQVRSFRSEFEHPWPDNSRTGSRGRQPCLRRY